MLRSQPTLTKLEANKLLWRNDAAPVTMAMVLQLAVVAAVLTGVVVLMVVLEARVAVVVAFNANRDGVDSPLADVAATSTRDVARHRLLKWQTSTS